MQSEAVLASCARIYNKCVYRAGWLWRRSWACYSWPHSRRQSRRCWWRKCHSIAHKRSPDLQRRERKKKKKTDEEDDDEEYKHTWIQNFWRVGLHKIWVICVCLGVCVLRTAVGVHTVETGSKEHAVMAWRMVHDVEDGHGRWSVQQTWEDGQQATAEETRGRTVRLEVPA